MKRLSQRTAAGARRFITGAALVAWSIAAFSAASATTSSAGAPGHDPTFANASGVHRTISVAGTIDESNPFFEELGTNGRRCVTCHQPQEGWTITPDGVRDRFERSAGLDPLFRNNDGSTCEGGDVSTLALRRRAFELVMSKGLIRVGLDVPADAEFEVAGIDDPYGCQQTFTSLSMYRRPLPTTNLRFISAVMWDGRSTAPHTAIRDDLLAQTRDAVTGHAAGTPPSPAQLRAIVDFELGLFTGQTGDRSAGTLTAAGVRGGPSTLAREPFCLGINDPLRMLPLMPGACLAASASFDPVVFTLFGDWSSSPSPERQAIARGEAIFNTHPFVIDNVPGLNGRPEDPVAGPIQNGTCTLCHDTPNAGNHSVALALNLGVVDASRRTPDLPLYTLRHRTTGELVQVTDPGRAMVTGRWNDIGKFKGPVLRALAARPPYFHDGSATTLGDAINFYDTRFKIGLSAREKADLLAFLQAL
jgi:cytochrome c peroxidase